MNNIIELNEFVSEFNKTKRTIGDFLKIGKKYNISMDELGDPLENDSEYIWQINGIGTLYQCKDCRSMEFVEIGKSKTHC